MWAGGCEIDFVVNLERFARPVVCHFVFQANPVVPGTIDMSFAFHIEVATGMGKPDDAASAGAKPDQAVTAQRVNVDPKCEFALYRRPPAISSAAKSTHLADLSQTPIFRNQLSKRPPSLILLNLAISRTIMARSSALLLNVSSAWNASYGGLPLAEIPVAAQCRRGGGFATARPLYCSGKALLSGPPRFLEPRTRLKARLASGRP